jgi:hypothetical protein
MISSKVILAIVQLPLAAATCESLQSLAIPHTTITLAQSVQPDNSRFPLELRPASADAGQISRIFRRSAA